MNKYISNKIDPHRNQSIVNQVLKQLVGYKFLCQSCSLVVGSTTQNTKQTTTSTQPDLSLWVRPLQYLSLISICVYMSINVSCPDFLQLTSFVIPLKYSDRSTTSTSTTNTQCPYLRLVSGSFYWHECHCNTSTTIVTMLSILTRVGNSDCNEFKVPDIDYPIMRLSLRGVIVLRGIFAKLQNKS
jgi:hypothetical protein